MKNFKIIILSTFVGLGFLGTHSNATSQVMSGYSASDSEQEDIDELIFVKKDITKSSQLKEPKKTREEVISELKSAREKGLLNPNETYPQEWVESNKNQDRR